MRPPGRAEQHRAIREAGYVLSIFLAFPICLLLTAGSLTAAEEEEGVPSAGESRNIFLEKCSRCHEPERAYTVIVERKEWTVTVARMAVKDRAWMAAADVKRIIAYQADYPAVQQAVFDKKCGSCHKWDEIRGFEMGDSQLRLYINFMSQRHGGEITMEECELLLSGLKSGT